MTSDDRWGQADRTDGADPFAPSQAGQAPFPAASPVPLGPPMGQPWPTTPAPGYPPAPGAPAPGGFPPPPAYGAPYGYPPAPGYGVMYGYPPVGLPFAPLPPLATWPYRVGAFLVDNAVPGALGIIGLVIWLPTYIRFVTTLASQAATNNGQLSPAVAFPMGSTYLLLMLLNLAGFGFTLWNRTFRQGRTGQSIGKQALGIRLLSERTMAPVGAGTAFLRDLAHYVDGAAMYIGYLWPLWDEKRQTFADKICRTVVVVDPKPRGR